MISKELEKKLNALVIKWIGEEPYGVKRMAIGGDIVNLLYHNKDRHE